MIYGVISKVKRVFGKQDPSKGLVGKVLPRSEHNISRKDISENALKVLYRLHKAGFQAYLVGGCVRDLLLGLHPKDFDVVTDATPDEVKGLFRNCRLVGRRFRLAHVMFGREIIEVATFRGHHGTEEAESKSDKLGQQSEEGMILRDNVFGTIEEDAQRRDFTVNAMYYNIADYSVQDFAGGIEALRKREIRLIGDPETRYREDPVRMLRAARFAAKLDMKISAQAGNVIPELAPLLANVAPARLFEEVLKLLLSGKGLRTFEVLWDYKLFQQLFPQLTPFLSNQGGREVDFLEKVLVNTDNRIINEQRVTPAFIYAAFLWYPLEARTQQLIAEGGFNHHDAFNLAINDVIDRQVQRIMIPKRFSGPIREIWQLQQRLPKRFGRRAYQLLEHPRFRAAFDFLQLRGQVEGGELHELADWWEQFQEADQNQRKSMLNALRGSNPSPRRRRRPKPRKSAE